jgi:hypothetical protein
MTPLEVAAVLAGVLCGIPIGAALLWWVLCAVMGRAPRAGPGVRR